MDDELSRTNQGVRCTARGAIHHPVCWSNGGIKCKLVIAGFIVNWALTAAAAAGATLSIKVKANCV